MFVSSSSLSSASPSSQKIFKAIARLLNDGTYHSQFGALQSVADEANYYTYKQAGRDKVCTVSKQFIDERVSIGLYEGAPAQIYFR